MQGDPDLEIYKKIVLDDKVHEPAKAAEEESKAQNKSKTKRKPKKEVDYGKFSLFERENEFDHTDFEALRVEAHFLKLSFDRPWIDQRLFKNKLISVKGLRKNEVSRGYSRSLSHLYGDDENPLIPYMATSAILAVNVKISGFSKGQQTTTAKLANLKKGVASRILCFDIAAEDQANLGTWAPIVT